jgi:predicted transcriptional regulator
VKPPTDNMNNIATVLADGPLEWSQIQTALEGSFHRIHGAVLIGILNRMIDRGLIAQDNNLYRLADAPPRAPSKDDE